MNSEQKNERINESKENRLAAERREAEEKRGTRVTIVSEEKRKQSEVPLPAKRVRTNSEEQAKRYRLALKQ